MMTQFDMVEGAKAFHFETDTWYGRGTPNGPEQDEANVREAFRKAKAMSRTTGRTIRWVVDEDFIFTLVNMIGPEYDSIIVTDEDEAVRIWWENYCLPTWEGPDYDEPDEWTAEYKAHFEPRYTH